MKHNTISFTDTDYERMDRNHTEALVITLDIAENEVKRILLDNGSSVDICFKHTWERLKLGSTILEKCHDETPLYDFGNNAVPITGITRLPVYFGKRLKQVCHVIKFYVINTVSSYNMIVERPTLNTFVAITSTAHLKIKFHTLGGVGDIKDNL